MRRTTYLAVCIMTLSLLTAGGANAVQYEITDLGDLGNGNSGANSINNLGQVVGWSNPASSPYRRHAFIWENGLMTDLDSTLPLNAHSVAYGINDAGQVVGEFGPYSDDCHAFVWQNGVMTDISGGKYSEALAINNQGQITGGIGDADLRAVVWNGGSPTYLPDPGGSFNWTEGFAINELGQVSGGCMNGALVWQNSVASSLGPYPYEARGINDSGQIVGDANFPGHTGAFLWENGVTMELLGIGINNDASAINNKGQIVGATYLQFDAHAGLWQDGVFIDLNDAIAPNTGWVLNWAHDINESGQIVGSGTHNGFTRAFLLTPVPEPASLLSLLMGSCCLGFFRRRGKG